MKARLPEDVVIYCRIHAKKCEDEGLHMRAIVLEEAADEIERLRAEAKKKETV